MEDSIVEDVTAALSKHVQHFGPEDMQLAHVKDWVIVYSIEDAANPIYSHVRVSGPEFQATYVSNGLLDYAKDILKDSQWDWETGDEEEA